MHHGCRRVTWNALLATIAIPPMLLLLPLRTLGVCKLHNEGPRTGHVRDCSIVLLHCSLCVPPFVIQHHCAAFRLAGVFVGEEHAGLDRAKL